LAQRGFDLGTTSSPAASSRRSTQRQIRPVSSSRHGHGAWTLARVSDDLEVC
jgi:hypothetical protein